MIASKIRTIIHFYRTGPDQPLCTIDPAVLKSLYERRRRSVFLTITLGYGFFYICRLSFSVVKKPMLDEGILTAEQMGIIGSAFLFIYALGKLVNGFLSDVTNVRKFMSTGLLLSAVVNLCLGFTELFIVFAVLWGVNGWFQSMGAAPSVVSISQWFSNRERGTRYGIWSIAHNIGEGLTFAGTSLLVSVLGWKWGFWGPGIACTLVAVAIYIAHSDRPETCGLPSVADYKNDYSAGVGTSESTGTKQREVLKNPAVWILGLSSALMYAARYGINNWGILYLQETKHYSLVDAGSVLAACTIMGIPGTASSGYLSDRFFHSRRNMPLLLYGLLEIGALTVFFLIPPGHRWLDTLSMAVFGFAIGGLLVFLGGLMAVDICSKKASGAALGLVGMFSYLGAAIQDVLSGYFINTSKTVVGGTVLYNFDNAFYCWIGASILSMVLASSLWNAKPRE